MFYLALETVNNICSVALAENEALIDYIEELNPSQQSKRLFAMIEEILSRNHLSYKNLHKLAINIGPGSFTGVRIGIASVKGLMIALPELEIMSVTSLEALYTTAPSSLKQAVTVLDASRNQVYCQKFYLNKADCSSAPQLVEIKDFNNYADHSYTLIGSGSKFFQAQAYNIVNDLAPNAKMVLKAAWLKEKNLLPAHELLPFYMRAPDAKIKFNPVKII